MARVLAGDAMADDDDYKSKPMVQVSGLPSELARHYISDSSTLTSIA